SYRSFGLKTLGNIYKEGDELPPFPLPDFKKALSFLLNQQHNEGYWEATSSFSWNKVESTTAALYGLVGTGNKGEVVEKGINWLIKNQKANGSWNDDCWDTSWTLYLLLYNNHESEEGAYEMSFTTLDIILKEDVQKFFKNQRIPQEMSSKELRQQIDILQQAGVDTKSFEVDLYMKYSVPFSGLIFVLLGVPLGLRVKRGSKATGIIISIVLVFIYYISVSTIRSFGRGGIIFPVLAAWLPNIIFAILGTILIFRAEKK
ncbi:unnamed protein product, partial [marine sediment metagenome]